jgi:hypothetical protein
VQLEQESEHNTESVEVSSTIVVIELEVIEPAQSDGLWSME